MNGDREKQRVYESARLDCSPTVLPLSAPAAIGDPPPLPALQPFLNSSERRALLIENAELAKKLYGEGKITDEALRLAGYALLEHIADDTHQMLREKGLVV